MPRPIRTAPLLLASLVCLSSRNAGAQDDPAPLRLQLLREMDTRISAAAARAHIEARLMLDSTMPIAFLGMVADEKGGELVVTQIYRESGAADAALQVGDVIVALAGKDMTGKAQLYGEIRRHRPGETVDLRIRRDHQELVLHPTLGMRWEEDEEDAEQYGDITPAPFVAQGLPVTLNFDGDAPGALSPSLEQVLGGLGAEPRYIVAHDGAIVALRQDAPDKMGIRFPMVLVQGVDAADVVGRTRFRVVAGAQDRAAGILLHYQDPANYLVARANAVEGDLRIFRTVNGLRRTLPGAVAQIQIDDDAWHQLEFRAEGPKLTAVLDGTITIGSFDTFFEHGRVGLWTKSDSVTEFDDVSFAAP